MTNFNVRIAPSPSGTLHLGNAKTALFNFLFAKSKGANFILRIEDTDQSRVVKNGAENILNDLKWLGIAPDTGFGTDNKPARAYTQMERLRSYQEIALLLVKEGHAYKCYCTQEELDKQREEALIKDPKKPFKYPGTCRNLVKDLEKPYVIRFKAPTEGYTEFEDVTFGKRRVPNKENYDFVILRASGIPLYNFAVVCDDAMSDGVTHVIRGSDHVKNMTQQILLYNALNFNLPVFCHLPMLLNKDGAKLSKRDGSVSVAEYRSMGYAPQAILNYLAKFGWSLGNKEVFSLDEMIENFKLEDCHCRDGKYDPVKFLAINYEHLKSKILTPDDEYVRLLKPFIDAKNIGQFSKEQLKPFISVVRSRAKTFIEASDLIEPMLRNDVNATPELMQKTFNEKNVSYLKRLNDVFAAVDNWNECNLRDSVQNWLKEENLSLKDVGGALRCALLGTTNSPELFSVMEALGREKSLSRLNHTTNQLRTYGCELPPTKVDGF